MLVKDKIILNKNKLIAVVVLLSILVFSYVSLVVYNLKLLDKYSSIVLPNVYIENINMSNYSFNSAKDRLDFYSEKILSKKIKFMIDGKDYEYVINQLGLTIDKEVTINSVKEYQAGLDYNKLIRSVNGKIKKEFAVSYKVDESNLREFLNEVKKKVDIEAVDGHFDTANGVKYVPGIAGYSLDIDASLKVIKDFFTSNGNLRETIELIGDVKQANSNDSYKTIDTMTSSFVTNFNVNQGTRPINLRTALNYINGAVVEPGEIFSYYKYAGPYNKRGYVFYYEFVGNGVCQIATTVYNAVLLGGLEVVKRYPHAKKSVYVAGGLDATVASYSSGWNVDFQFKNTYKYPIYIKAYAVGGEAHVEFWSNSQAKEGKTYSTESVNIGRRGYTTYLHTYKDGQEISKDKITTTWYTEE